MLSAASSDGRLFSPGSGFQTGTSLLQALSPVWGISCLLVQEVSGEDTGRKAGRRRGLGSPNVPGPQPPPLQGGVITAPASGARGVMGATLCCQGAALGEQG